MHLHALLLKEIWKKEVNGSLDKEIFIGFTVFVPENFCPPEIQNLDQISLGRLGFCFKLVWLLWGGKKKASHSETSLWAAIKHKITI